MSRIPLAEVDDLDPFLRTMHDGAAPDDWATQHCARAFNTQPRMLEDYLTFYYPWHKEKGVISSRMKELVRLHIATLNGCRTCAAARLSPESVLETEALGALGTEAAGLSTLSASERIALDFASRMAVDHHSITDEDVRLWRDTFGDEGFLELAMMTTQYIGFGRVLAMLQLETVACPV
jgi:alkylhydroperoxidase family enzyme